MNGDYIEFYLNKFSYKNKDEDLDLSFLPPLMRRRLSTLDKYTLSVLNEVYTDDIENIVYSSRAGEFERLLKLIEQYSEEKEVSPNTFAGSVHNFGVSFFLMNRQKPISYTALSGGETSFSSGFLSGVVSGYDKVLYCYSDVNDSGNFSFAASVGINGDVSAKYRLRVKNNADVLDKSDDYLVLFSGETDKIITPYFELERVRND